MWIIETEPIKHEYEAAESGEDVKNGCDSGCAEDREWGDIFDAVGEYEVTENEDVEIREEDFFYSVFVLKDMAFYRNNYVFCY